MLLKDLRAGLGGGTQGSALPFPTLPLPHFFPVPFLTATPTPAPLPPTCAPCIFHGVRIVMLAPELPQVDGSPDDVRCSGVRLCLIELDRNKWSPVPSSRAKGG